MTFVLAYTVELRFRECRSLKQKRAHLKPIVEGIRQRFAVSVAELDFQDTWQRSRIGVVAISASHSQVVELIDDIERFVWSFPDAELLTSDRHWLEVEH